MNYVINFMLIVNEKLVNSIFSLPKIQVQLFLLFLLVSFITGCNEKPTDIGYSLLTDTVAIKSIVDSNQKLITEIKSYKFCLPKSNAGILYIGKYLDKDGEYEAISMSEFLIQGGYVDSSRIDSIAKSKKIVSAKLNINPLRYAFGGNDTTNGNLSFSIYRFKTFKTFLYDSCYDEPRDLLDLNRIVGNYSGGIKLKDTLDKIAIDIDTALIREWFLASADTTQDSLIYGIGYIPDPSTTVINQFVSSPALIESNLPEIVITYSYDGTEDDTVKINSIDMSFIKAPGLADKKFVVQGGVSYRTDIYFNIDTIPQNSGILNAELELFINTEESRRGNFPFDMVLGASYSLDTNVGNGNLRITLGELDTVNMKYRFKVLAPSIEIWNRNKNIGKIILNYSSNEFTEKIRLDRLVFYGLDAPDPAKRPKLKIIYASRPKTR